MDLLIPRGGAGLIRACVENATVPCIETGTGICHVYVDEYADLDKAAEHHRKRQGQPPLRLQRRGGLPGPLRRRGEVPAHAEEGARGRPPSRRGLSPVELRLDPARRRHHRRHARGSERDFDTEFLDYILAVGVVDSVDEAIAPHRRATPPATASAIVTEDAAKRPSASCREMDSAAVYVNVSTRFTDGGEFGLGCEMGISTQKLHARGPMGLDELSTYKYIIRGNGQIR